MEEPVPLRERMRQRVAAEIEDAAFALFRQQGYEVTTVEQIAAAAGISTRTFFRYFPTKEDVVFAHHGADVTHFRASLAAQPPGVAPVDLVFAALSTRPERWYQSHGPERLRLLGNEPALRAHEARLGEDLEDALVEELVARFGNGPEGRLWAAIVAGAIFGGLRGARRVLGDHPGRSLQDVFVTTHAVLSGLKAHLPAPPPPAMPRTEDDERDRPP